MNWHYVEAGQQVGPVTDDQLLQFFQTGKITADTLVWREGLPDWITYHQVSPSLVPGSSLQPPAPPPLLANLPNAGEVICAECGKVFPVNETIRVGKASVCAACKPVFLQKLSEGARINTGELNYVGFWTRFAAKFLDLLILGIPFGIAYVAVVFPIITASAHNGSQPPQLGLLPILLQFGFLFVIVLYDTFFLGRYGATPGKMACKIKVVTGDGEKISYGRAAGRSLAERLSGMICYIGYIMVAFDDQKRALHDHICNTRVIFK